MIEKYVNELQAPIYYLAGLPEVVGAMKAVLLAAGIQQDSIRAEEFYGFKMDHANDAAAKRRLKRHPPVIGIGLLLLARNSLHGAGGVFIFPPGPGFFSL